MVDELRGQIQELGVSIGNIIAAIERGVFSASMQTRLSDLEAQKKALDEELAYAKARRAPKVAREDLIALLNIYKDGDLNDKEYQEKLIDTFLIAVYVYDDHLHIVFDFGAEEADRDITLDTVEDADSQGDALCSYKRPSAPPKFLIRTPMSGCSYKSISAPPKFLIRTPTATIIAVGTCAFMLICARKQ